MDIVDLIEKTAIDEPGEGKFIFPCPCAFPDKPIYKLPVLLCQLGRNGIPKRTDPRNHIPGRMLGKIQFISGKDARLNVPYCLKVFMLCERPDRLRHAADKVI